MNLEGAVALVTGAAHRVGKRIALALAAEGAHIIVHYGRSEAQARQTAAEIEAMGGRALPVSANLADASAIDHLYEGISTEFKRLDVLVNSAARFDRARFEDITVEEWEATMAVNLRAPFLMIQRGLPLLRTSRQGESPACVVNIGDLSGERAWARFAHHGTSKAGLLHLTRIAARELAPDIRVNALVLGPTIPTQGQDGTNQAWQRTVDRLPLKTATDPDEVGQAVSFIAKTDTMTGAVIHLDSGEYIGPSTH